MSDVCGIKERNKGKRGNAPKHTKEGGETPQNAAQAPTPFTVKKLIQSPFRRETQKRQKRKLKNTQRKETQKHVTTLDL